MCAFKDPFGCEAVSDSWYNQSLCFLESQILTQPCSLFHLQLGATVKHHLSIPVRSPRLWCVLSCQWCTQITHWCHGMTGGLAHCYFGCVCNFHVFGKAAGQEQPDCPEMFASPTALLFPCQKTLPERGQQGNAIDASDEVWESRSSLVCSVLSRAGEHYPSLGCHLSSLLSAIVTWGLSGWKSLLGLPLLPQVPLQRICASVSLYCCWLSCELCCTFPEEKENYSYFRKGIELDCQNGLLALWLSSEVPAELSFLISGNDLCLLAFHANSPFSLC